MEAMASVVDRVLGAFAPDVAAAVLADDPAALRALAWRLDEVVHGGADASAAVLAAAVGGGLVDSIGQVDLARADWIVDNEDSPAGWLTRKLIDHGPGTVPAGLLARVSD